MDAVNDGMGSDTRNRQSSLPILSLFSGCLHAHYVAYLHISENTMNAESYGFRETYATIQLPKPPQSYK